MDASKPISLGAGASSGPKSPKSARTPTPAPTGSASDTELLLFALTECKTFFGKLASTVQTAAEEGKQPESLFKAGKAFVPKVEKVKRKPSAFNIFVQKKRAQISKKEDIGPGAPENNAAFGQAAAAWSALSEAQRLAYMAVHAKNPNDPALDNLPEPEVKPENSPKPETEPTPATTAKPGETSKTAEKKRKNTEALEASKGADEKQDKQAGSADTAGKKKKKRKSAVTAAVPSTVK